MNLRSKTSHRHRSWDCGSTEIACGTVQADILMVTDGEIPAAGEDVLERLAGARAYLGLQVWLAPSLSRNDERFHICAAQPPVISMAVTLCCGGTTMASGS